MIEFTPYTDSRGSFARLFCDDELRLVLNGRRIAQINHSLTRAKGAIRGMHYQKPPHAEMKMVQCIRGRVFDVVLDLRNGSDTFLKWISHELSPTTPSMLIIPEGCAHGFQTLEEEAEMLYFHTAIYVPESEGGVRYDDPLVAIDWPLPVSDLSERDRMHPLLTSDFTGLNV